MTLLTLDSLRVGTPERTLVHPLSLTIDRGERLGLIGESGSGKSLTALAIMGLLPEGVDAAGSASLSGREILGRPEREVARRRGREMSMVFQEPLSALNPLMRAGDQIAEAMELVGVGRAPARRRSLELLETVGMPDPNRAAAAYPHQLSGGQRQRVMLAMALANEPALLICDEPTTALDVTVQAQVLDVIARAVQDTGTALLFITHDLAVVQSVCERVVVLHEGEAVESGDVDAVFSAPAHAYTRGLLAASDLRRTDARGRLLTIASAAGDEAGIVAPGATTGADAGEARSAEAHPQAGRPDAGAVVVQASGLGRAFAAPRRGLLGPRRTVRALEGIDLTVRHGQRFGIVGESGSGKSTLLTILAGLDRPTTGTARVTGVDVGKASAAELRGLREELQMVFQDPFGSLDPRMTIADVLAEPAKSAGVSARDRRERMHELLDAVGLPRDSLTRYPHQFSGGQRQRISIARALMTRPRVLLADEPVSALDVSVRAQVLNILSDLVDEYGLTLLFVSHDLGVVRHVCTDVAVMRSGRIVEQGPVEQVYEAPREAYTRELIAATPRLRVAG